MTTITTNLGRGVALATPAYANPVSITSGGTVAGTASGVGYAAALYGSGQAWTVTNAGAILGPTTGSSKASGIFLAAGGAVSNVSGATISGYSFGVLSTGGTVANSGQIASGRTAGNGYVYSTTGGFTAVSAAVSLSSGGVSNAAGGTIAGYFQGVVASGGASVTNAGLIKATGTASSFGVVLTNGGTVTDALGGTISATSVGILTFGTNINAIDQGTISVPSSFGTGIDLFTGGTATVGATGLITAGYFGIDAVNAAATVTNLGTIASTKTMAGAGVSLAMGGTVTNGVGADISAEWIGVGVGLTTRNATGTVLNSGTIFASDGTNGAALWLHGAAVVDNYSSGTISGGPYAIVSYAGLSLVNRGTISGTQWAVDPVTPGNVEQVVVSPGAKFVGKVSGGNTIGSTVVSVLELASGASAGTISGLNSQYIDFGRVTIDPGANWTLAGTVVAGQTIAFAGTASTGTLTLTNPGPFAGTIAGFGAAETLVLSGITDVTGVTLASGNTLEVTQSAGATLNFQLDPSQTFSGTFFDTTMTGATAINISCFAAGTRIRTMDGFMAVEDLRTGMWVLTERGEAETVKWVGHRAVNCRAHPNPASIWPVRIAADAFGPGRPSRDLRLSPDHAMYVDGVLIPVRYLVNGGSIRREPVAEVVYYHVELRQHDVILAEDLPVESYLDTGDRANFANAEGAIRLFADFLRDDRVGAVWEAYGCAPLVVTGPVLDAVRRELAARTPDRLTGPRAQERLQDREEPGGIVRMHPIARVLDRDKPSGREMPAQTVRDSFG
jgi:hypothetical protein